MNQNSNAVNLDEVLRFVRHNAMPLALRGAVSLGVVAGIFAAYMAFSPRSESYKLEFQVALPERNGLLVYENNTPFSTSDLVSAPVLQELWKEYGFAEHGVKFGDFTSEFAVFSWNKDRAAIDAEYSAKLSKRNITMADIETAQKLYNERLATLDKHSFAVTYSAKGIGTDREQISRMLAELPVRWAERSRRVYAPTIPVLPNAESVKVVLARFAKLPMAEFDTLDYLSQYCAQLRSTCSFVSRLMKDKNLELDRNTVGTLSARIDLAERENERMFVTLLSSPQHGKAAVRFANGRRETFSRDMAALDRQIAAVKTAISALAPNRAAGSKDSDAGLTVQADGNFLGQYADLVKQSVHSDEITKYVAEQVRLETEYANLTRRDLAYAQIEKAIEGANVAAPADAAVAPNGLLAAMVDSIVSLGGDVERFRDFVIDNAFPDSDFFRVQTPVYYAKSYRISLPRILVGLMAFWFLYNLAYLVVAWNGFGKAK